ncbi:MAG TPA: TonB-dependent receptor [Gammaproteobacteria bacterium]|nr:TonB-dependent receptor [Gammaproteobacteria bacterium]
MTRQHLFAWTRSPLSASVAALLASAPLAARAQDASPSAPETIVVTGFRGSLQESTDFKRNSVGFADAIFAEDIGKFPDTNIAESFNRIPGITISREITGEGLNVTIRGLGTNFTKILLNDAPVAVASTGRTDSQNTNREVDLDMFPTELFTQLTVNKTSTAQTIEGGAAGTVNMRSARPFDNPGGQLAYSFHGMDNSEADDLGERASLLWSHTWNDKWGLLAGAAAVRNKVRVTGFETIGWTNAGLSTPSATVTTPQCVPSATVTCNATGGGNWSIPGTVPANAGNGLAQGAVIDQAFLLARNPGATIQQLDNGLIPRLGRPSDEFGDKDRDNAIVSFEWRPSDNFNFYVDSMYGKRENDLQRIDMNWVGRNGSMIPLNLTFDRADCTQGCVVTSGTFANAQFFLEYRPFIETVEFRGVNPGFSWNISDKLAMNVAANYTSSDFHRESPTALVITPGSSGVTVSYRNDGGIPQITPNVDLNNPANFNWPGGRVNIQDEQRKTETKGLHANFTFGDADGVQLGFGAAYDDVMRQINAFDNSQAWQNAVCGNQPSIFVDPPNAQPPCNGLNVPVTVTAGGTNVPAGHPNYPALGTNFTAGRPNTFSYLGSLVPAGAPVQSLLTPGPDGFITVDWKRFVGASQYDAFHSAAPETGASNTGANGGLVEEKVTGAYFEVNGDNDVADLRLRYNAGIRYVHTDQTIGGRISIPDPRNPPNAPGTNAPPPAAQGGLYPNTINFAKTEHTYENWLPAASLSVGLTDSAIARVALSRTMTRPDPNAMLPGLSFTSPSADVGTLGNSALDPFLSDNIDLGLEYYTSREGMIGAAVFRKSIEGFTVNGNVTVPFSSLAPFGVTFSTLTPTQQTAINSRGGPDVATVVIQQQVNASGKLNVNGMEFTYVQPLPAGFGLAVNHTIIDQKGSGAAPAVAIGVSPHTTNLTWYYERGGISVRFSGTATEGSQVANANQNGIAAAALFGDDYTQWDMSTSFDLGAIGNRERSLLPQITLDVINLTDEEQRSYFQFANATFTSYAPGRQVVLGVRGHF